MLKCNQCYFFHESKLLMEITVPVHEARGENANYYDRINPCFRDPNHRDYMLRAFGWSWMEYPPRGVQVCRYFVKHQPRVHC
jgi:hypothetical protein